LTLFLFRHILDDSDSMIDLFKRGASYKNDGLINNKQSVFVDNLIDSFIYPMRNIVIVIDILFVHVSLQI